MNKLFKDNIIEVSIIVNGETDTYEVKVSWGGFLTSLQGYMRKLNEEDLTFGNEEKVKELEGKRIIEKFGETHSVIVMADHGGHDRTHGSEMPEDMLIPVIISGTANRIKSGSIGP